MKVRNSSLKKIYTVGQQLLPTDKFKQTTCNNRLLTNDQQMTNELSCSVCCGLRKSTVKALLSPWGAYLISGLHRGGLIQKGALIERGGGVFQDVYF